MRPDTNSNFWNFLDQQATATDKNLSRLFRANYSWWMSDNGDRSREEYRFQLQFEEDEELEAMAKAAFVSPPTQWLPYYGEVPKYGLADPRKRGIYGQIEDQKRAVTFIMFSDGGVQIRTVFKTNRPL